MTVEVLEMIGEYVVSSVSIEELDHRCNEYIRKVSTRWPSSTTAGPWSRVAARCRLSGNT